METRDETALHKQVREILADYDTDLEAVEDAKEAAIRRRDERIRALHTEKGWRQTDLISATGYTRETIRQALNPEIREAVKARRVAKRKGTSPGG